jgi:hypothetical protein
MTNYTGLNDELHELCGYIGHGCWDWLQLENDEALPETVYKAAKAWAAMQYAGCAMYGEITAQATYAAMAAAGGELTGDASAYLAQLCEMAQAIHEKGPEQDKPQKQKGKKGKQAKQEAGKLPKWPDPADVSHLQACWEL